MEVDNKLGKRAKLQTESVIMLIHRQDSRKYKLRLKYRFYTNLEGLKSFNPDKEV